MGELRSPLQHFAVGQRTALREMQKRGAGAWKARAKTREEIGAHGVGTSTHSTPVNLPFFT